MLTIDNRNMSFDGTSTQNGQTLHFNANINDSENRGYLNIDINNWEAFRTSINGFKADIVAFIDELLKYPAQDE